MSDQNIKVCCRFRPVNKIEQKSKGHKIVVKVNSDCKSVVVGSSKKSKNFNFDYVFPSNSNQETVFNYSALPLVDAVMAGYNCTLFAYGQTGTGKTYSMEGVIGDPVHEGLIPRMVRTIFDRILNENSVTFEYTLRVSFVEIYNEKLRDLLQPNGAPLKIREKQSGAKGVYIENVHAPFVASPEEVFDHLTNGHVNRSVASTRMNEHSSRSHAVFMLQLDARNTETGSSKASKLMLVDLAGSEKVKKTHASGQTLKEAKQINKSLMVLGLVINALVEKKKHVPYRDSKLTRLLSDALGGNSKTMLIVTASPSKYNQDETVSTCRFGTRAKAIKNEAQINQELSVSEYQRLLEKSKKREEILKQQIRSLQTRNDALIKACNDNNIDISKTLKLSSSNGMINAGHKAAQNTTALVTMVATNNADESETIAKMEALQSKLDSVNDEKLKLDSNLSAKQQELTDATQELNECHTHIEDLQQQMRELQTRYEELYSAKSHVDKLFQSLNSGNDATQNRFNTERLEWNEDKLQLLDDIRTKDNKIEQLQLTTNEYEKQINELREQLSSDNKPSIPSSTQSQIDVNVNGTDNAEYKQKMIALLDTARKYRAQNEKYGEDNRKLKEKLKAYKRRDEVNKQLRDNWNKQLNQMEQAVLLANEIYNRERTRHEAEIAEKDVEILKLRKFLLSFTTRHAKSSKSLVSSSNGNGTEKAVNNNNNNLVATTTPNGPNPNAPGARKSRIVKPKVIKAGGHAIRPKTIKSSQRQQMEHKSDD